MINDVIMTVKELAEYLKITEKTAYRFASEGKVPGFKVGSAWPLRKMRSIYGLKHSAKQTIKQHLE